MVHHAVTVCLGLKHCQKHDLSPFPSVVCSLACGNPQLRCCSETCQVVLSQVRNQDIPMDCCFWTITKIPDEPLSSNCHNHWNIWEQLRSNCHKHFWTTAFKPFQTATMVCNNLLSNCHKFCHKHFQTTVLPQSAAEAGRFPPIAVKLNVLMAKTKPSSGRYSSLLWIPGALTGCCW